MKLDEIRRNITSKTIEAEIKKRFGYDVELVRGNAYFYFADVGNSNSLASWKSTSVCVNSINQLSLDQWVSEFEILMQENE